MDLELIIKTRDTEVCLVKYRAFPSSFKAISVRDGDALYSIEFSSLNRSSKTIYVILCFSITISLASVAEIFTDFHGKEKGNEVESGGGVLYRCRNHQATRHNRST